MENLVFLSPLFWIISFIIWIIWLYLFYKTKDFWIKAWFFNDLEKVFGTKNYFFRFNLLILFVIITIFSIILRDPNIKNQNQEIKKNWIDIVIVFDLSYSMMAEDLRPNRLEIAKEVLSNFVLKLQTDRLWFVIFSWKPFVWVPLTFDYNFVSKYIKNLDIQKINQDYSHLQWTAIWDGLLYGANLFKDDDREKVIVLFTDWEANRWVDPLLALKYIKSKNIKIHTVWIWWDKETYVLVKNVFGTQKIPIWWVDEDMLKKIASISWWEYYRANNNEVFKKIFDKLNIIQKKDIEINEYVFYKQYYSFFINILYYLVWIFLIINFYFFVRVKLW